ncbi:MAG: BREX system Lon protease-like protein BrxL [Myxococcota bacterium]
MVFIGNIDNVKALLKTSHLLCLPRRHDRRHLRPPLPRLHPRLGDPEDAARFFTNQYGFIVDYLAEFFREMRKQNFGDAISKYFRLGRDLNQRDTIAVKHTVSDS